MNKSELIQIIREVVKAELKKAGPALIREALLESLQKQTEELPFRPAPTLKSIMEEEAPIAPEPREKRPFVQYTKDPVLNEIMNQTSGGVPPDATALVQMEGEVSKVDILRNAPKEVLTENSQLDVVAKALKKDYRGLLKAVEQKVRR